MLQIKLLQMVNQADPEDVKGIVRLRHFFYWREHLVLATELLHLNLYQCARRATHAADRYFTLDRVREIAVQVRTSSCMHLLPPHGSRPSLIHSPPAPSLPGGCFTPARPLWHRPSMAVVCQAYATRPRHC